MTRESDIAELQAGLSRFLVGKDKELTIIAALSIAATTAFMIGLPKLELQKMLVRMYDRRVAEAQRAGTSDRHETTERS